MTKPKKRKLVKKKAKGITSRDHSDWVSEKHIPAPRPDPEEADIDLLGDDEDFDVGAEHPYKEFPPPKKSREFRRRWRDMISAVVERDNFKDSHLMQLEILCDLYVEYEELSAFVRKQGYTYEAFGRQGKQIKPFPEVLQLNRVKSEIRNYSQMLGLVLHKDKAGKGMDHEGKKWE